MVQVKNFRVVVSMMLNNLKNTMKNPDVQDVMDLPWKPKNPLHPAYPLF